MKGRNPTSQEKKHMDRVSQLGCIVCRLQGMYGVPAEIHHIEGKTKIDAHMKILPLCFEHHRMGSDKEPISRHPYKKRFEEAYGSECELWVQVEQLLKKTSDHLPF
jgi:hypothetical protein